MRRLVPLAVLLVLAGPAALAREDAVDRITVQVSWPDENLLYLGYQISEEDDPLRHVADGPEAHGCASLPEGHDTSPDTLEVDTARHRAGRYLVIAYFTNWCLDYDAPEGEDADPLRASEAYPEGAPVEVTAAVSHWAGGSQVRTATLRGTARVAFGPISDHWAVLGVIELEAREVSEPIPGGEDDESTTPGAGSEVDGEEQAGDDGSAAWEPGSSGLPEGWGLAAVVIAIVLGVGSAALLVGYLVRLRMGWGGREAAMDAARAEGLEPSAGEDGCSLDALQEVAVELAGRPEPAPAPPLPPSPPGTPPTPGAAPAGGRDAHSQTPSSYHRTRPGLQPGSYRWVEFPDPVYLERLSPGGGVELVTTQLTGPVLVGPPDPAFAGHSPAYTQDGTRIGWVRTRDLPAG